MEGLYISPHVLPTIYNAGNLVLKILQHDKIWGRTISRSKFWGTCPPVIYAHGVYYFYMYVFADCVACK